MNNPMMQIMAMMRNGGNPMAMLQGMASGNPQMAQALQMIQGKSPQQLQQMAMNMAQEQGININELIQSLGIR